MDFIVWLCVGLICGILARILMPGPEEEAMGGIITDITIGMVGAYIAGYMVRTYYLAHFSTAYLWWNLLFAFAGAAGLLMMKRALTDQEDTSDSIPPL
ncbi:MAG TPA: GlsB/YeaQ/YmgE family stress response membrane protein [Chthonomonadaceae bacterium]|nr:GlsB/YeaQ/YmgE family stress response membrane protein [Chthonomonadaceae bacterium]